MEDIQENVSKTIKDKKAIVSDKFIQHKFNHTPFSINMHDVTFDRGWSYSCYEIFKTENKETRSLGKLFRNYGKSKKIFQPFMYEDKWLFLFSDMYTRVSVYDEKLIRLNSTNSNFCPMEIYIPKFKTDILSRYVFDNDENFESINSPITYANFGFMSGCYWGDDSSAKLRTLDLSDMEFFTDEEPYGSLEIPYDLRKTILFENRTYPATDNVTIISKTCVDNFKEFGD